MSTRRPPIRRGLRARARGVAMLMVITAITILALVLIQFSSQTRTHLLAGVNVRDELAAITLADTAIMLTRACLDPAGLLGGAEGGALAAIGAQQLSKTNPEKLCNLILNLFVASRLDLPIGGLSLEVEGIEGLGLRGAEVEELRLTSEDSFLALNGLRCPPGPQGEPGLNCPGQTLVVGVLRAMLCDRRLDAVFDVEQQDGRKYTRGEVIANLIDWIDADDQRTRVDEDLNWQIGPDPGDSEDGYFRARANRIETKNAPLDSIEELRLLPGVNSELFEFLRTRVSVYAKGQINANAVSEELLADLLWAKDPLNPLSKNGCEGLRSESLNLDDRDDPDQQGGLNRTMYRMVAKLFVRARQVRESRALLSEAFKDKNQFLQIARDPAAYICQNDPGLSPGAIIGAPPDPTAVEICKIRVVGQMLPEGVQWPNLDPYTQLMAQVNATLTQLSPDLTFQSSLLRLEVRTKAGNLTKRVFAVLRRGGQTTRPGQPQPVNPVPPVNPANPANPGAANPLGNPLDPTQNAVRVMYYREY